jgi:uncharacterized RDD family membrane protein YckC
MNDQPIINEVPAGFWIRTGAAVADVIIFVVPLSALLAWMQMNSPAAQQAWLRTAASIAPAIYTIACWIWNGATPGKQIFALRIVRDTDLQPARPGQLIVRYLAYMLSFAPLGLGCFWVGWDPRKQAFHDHIAGTMVLERKGSSSGWRLLVVGILGAILIALLAGWGMVRWFQGHASEFRAAGQRASSDAATFGKSHDQADCLAEALRRSDACTGILCRASARIFLKASLPNARPTTGFCDGMPPQSEFMKSVYWRVGRCSQMGRPQDQFCDQMLQEVQSFCGSLKK